MIDNKAFPKVSSLNFSHASKELCSGDLLFCSGNGLISDLIKKATSSAFSHVALILKLPITGQWLVLESVESIGVRCVTLLEGYLQNYQDSGRAYDGRMLVARHQDMQHKVAHLEHLYRRAFELTGDKYSHADIFKIGARIALNKIGIHESGEVEADNRYICSEYVYSCLKAVDINLHFDPLGFIAPADIAADPKIKPLLALEGSTLSASLPV
jgi:hypothetical protein